MYIYILQRAPHNAPTETNAQTTGGYRSTHTLLRCQKQMTTSGRRRATHKQSFDPCAICATSTLLRVKSMSTTFDMLQFHKQLAGVLFGYTATTVTVYTTLVLHPICMHLTFELTITSGHYIHDCILCLFN